MSMNTPYGSLISTKNLKEFQELNELGSEQYMVAIADDTTGTGGKIKATKLSSSMISSDADNQLIIGSDNKLYAKMSSITDVIDAQNMYETGRVLRDERGLNQLKEMKYSTFDSSKFQVVGSAVITDDGIASGFSGSNYLRTTTTIDFTKHWKITTPFKFSSTSGPQMLWCVMGGGWFNYVYISSNNVAFQLQKSDNSTYSITAIPTFNWEVDKIYIVEVEWDMSNYYLRVYSNIGELLASRTLSSSLPIKQSQGRVQLGFGSSGSYSFMGSIDLKQFSITVDGVEVFNGNKTGVDQIKKDDYTVVGTPTISADGVASGFKNGTNYLRTPVKTTDLLNHSWEIVSNFIPSTCISAFTFWKLSNPTSQTGAEGLSSCGFNPNNNNIIFWYRTGDSNESSAQLYQSINVANYLNERIYTSYSYNHNTGIYTFKAYLENGTVIATRNYTATTTNKQLYYINTESSFIVSIGTAYSGTADVGGNIDLNQYKVIIDENLVYQPTLRIPYTQSKTGSKIVDATYRDRVQDMYESFGYADYYTLGNTDFTLPMGEIYGMIKKDTQVIDDKLNDKLNNKLDLDASNLNTQGKDYISSLGMPSNRYINLTLGTSGSSYTATANGWFVLNVISDTNTNTIHTTQLSLNDTYQKAILRVSNTSGPNANIQLSSHIPVKKGDVCYVNYNAIVTTYTGYTNLGLYFVYAEGSN